MLTDTKILLLHNIMEHIIQRVIIITVTNGFITSLGLLPLLSNESERSSRGPIVTSVT